MPLPTPIVAVHGTGSNGAAMETYVAPFRELFAAGEVHWIFPTFEIPYHFLLPDADEHLTALVQQAEQRGDCAGPMLILGHSGGAQFAHRFAMKHPQMVGAAAVLSAGCWTNPGGESYGMMVEENWFEREPWNTPAIAAALSRPAGGDVAGIDWLVGCSDADLAPRQSSTRRFHADVQSARPYFAYSGKHIMPADEDASRFMEIVREQVNRLRERESRD